MSYIKSDKGNKDHREDQISETALIEPRHSLTDVVKLREHSTVKSERARYGAVLRSTRGLQATNLFFTRNLVN